MLEHTGDFAENKDIAAHLRESVIRAAVKDSNTLILDFNGVTLSTQSFIHALLSDVLRIEGEDLLERIDFRNCVPVIRGLVETVVQYSLESSEVEEKVSLAKVVKKRPSTTRSRAPATTA